MQRTVSVTLNCHIFTVDFISNIHLKFKISGYRPEIRFRKHAQQITSKRTTLDRPYTVQTMINYSQHKIWQSVHFQILLIFLGQTIWRANSSHTKIRMRKTLSNFNILSIRSSKPAASSAVDLPTGRDQLLVDKQVVLTTSVHPSAAPHELSRRI